MSSEYTITDEDMENFLSQSLGGEVVQREGVPKRAKTAKKPPRKPEPEHDENEEERDDGEEPQGSFGDPMAPSIDIAELRQGHAQILKRLTETQAMIRDLESAMDHGKQEVRIDGVDLTYLKPENMRKIFDALDKKLLSVQKVAKSYQDALATALRKAAMAGAVAGAVIGGIVAALIWGVQFIIK